MEKVELNQGILKHIEYDEQSRELHIHFKDGKYIIYYEVFKLDYVGLLSSKNYTEFYEKRIAPRFPSNVIRE